MEPRRGSRDINSPNVKRIPDPSSKSVLTANLRHVGACHLYVHLTEATTETEARGSLCRWTRRHHPRRQPSQPHAVPHLQPARPLAGCRALEYRSPGTPIRKPRRVEGFAIYPDHNLHMLLFAASMDGQGAIAIQAAKDYQAINGSNMMTYPDAGSLVSGDSTRFRTLRSAPPTRSRAESGISDKVTRSSGSAKRTWRRYTWRAY